MVDMSSSTQQSSITNSIHQSWSDRPASTARQAEASHRYSSPSAVLRSRSTRAQPSRLSERSISHRSTPETDEETVHGNDEPSRKFYIGIDYGTTFTSVSFCAVPTEDEEAGLVRDTDVKTIKNWPDEPTGLAEQVPTESWYSAVPMVRADAYNQFDAPSDGPSRIELLETQYEDDTVNETQVSPVTNEINIDEELDSDDEFDDDRSTEFFWGYTVAKQMYQENSRRDPRRLVQRPKLMMLSTSYTSCERRALFRQVKYL